LKGIGHHCRYDIHNAVGRAPVPGMLDRADIFPLIVGTLHQRSFAKQYFVQHWHQFVFPGALPFGNQLQILSQQLFKQFLTDRAAIAQQLAPQLADQFRDRSMIIGIARRVSVRPSTSPCSWITKCSLKP
jgi:hypothetical protein